MATPRQIRDIFAPVLATHPDLVLHKRWLFKPPIRSALVALNIGRTGHAAIASLTLQVIPLSRFDPPAARGLHRQFDVDEGTATAGTVEALAQEPPSSPFASDDMVAPDFGSRLVRSFDARARPVLDQVQTLDDVIAWVAPFREFPLRQGAPELIDAWVASMHGDFTVAADHMQALLDRMTPFSSVIGDAGLQFEKAILRVLRTGDRAAIAAFLHDLERRTIAAHGLERYWQPLPFPFERG
jgi:hypothetical protein